MIPLVNVTTAYGLALIGIGLWGGLQHQVAVGWFPFAIGLAVVVFGWFAGRERTALRACLAATALAFLVWITTSLAGINPFLLIAGPSSTIAQTLSNWTGLASGIYILSTIGWSIRRKIGLFPHI